MEECDNIPPSLTDGAFFDDFNAPQIDQCKWKVLHEAWTAADDNGGVIPENVTVRDGTVRLRAFGNRYDGAMRGVAADGSIRPDGRRSGAAISTRRHFNGGRFEARVRIAGELGVCSAMWTYFHAAEPDEPVLNHEIDIEFPGRENIDAPPSLKHVALTTWTGLQIGQSTTAFRPLKRSVSEFLVLRFDWQPPVEGQNGRVDFYIDGERIYTARTNIPSKPAPLLFGVWFPKEWAGNPDFNETDMLIDWVRVSPLADARTE